MKRLLILTALMLLITLQTEGGVIIDSINHTSATSLPRYSKFEVKIKLNQNFDPSQFFNVFDSTDIDMYAIFTSPTGKKYRRNAFWMTGREAQAKAKAKAKAKASHNSQLTTPDRAVGR